jgi:CelD/BcsL family acetyltransferase involved in cellulose biosynthesis
LVLRTGVLNGAGAFEGLRAPWEALVREAANATPFQTYAWQSTWWKYYGGLREARFFTVYEGQDLVGLMPLVRTRGPWRTVRPMGVGPSDYLHPITRNDYEERVSALLVQTLRESRDVDLVDLHQVRETRGLAAVSPGTRVDQATCLVVDLPDTYDAYLATLGKSLRYDVRKLDKSLFKEGRAKIRVCGPDDVREGLEVLFDLHRKRWKERHLPGAFLGKGIAFHHEWAQLAVREGWLRLGVLELDGAPIGAIYAMAVGETAYYYQAGFDPAQGAVSPGTLLVAHAIREAIDEGRRHFDFMRGDEGYKRRWKPQRELHNYRFVLPAGGLLGRMGSGWNLAGFRLETRIRARLEGKGLW